MFWLFNKDQLGQILQLFYVVSIVFSALATVDIVVGIIDLSFALMCIPNMIAIIYLSAYVNREMQKRKWIK